MARGSSSKYPPESDSESDYSSSSDDVEEDEFGEELTPALDAAILQTLGRIKRKEGVYGGENVLQEALKAAEEKAGALGVKTLKKVVEDKPYLLADHHRAALLYGTAEGIEEDEPLTNVQEQRMLRQGAISAFKSLADDEESEGEDGTGFVLKERKKDENEIGEEDEEYRKFLLDIGGGEEEVRKILGMGDAPAWNPDQEIVEPVKENGKRDKKKKKDGALSKVEKEEMDKDRQEKKAKDDDDFLMKGWIDRSEQKVPTYDQVVADIKDDVEEDDDEMDKSEHPWGVLDEDEFDEQAEEFETAYNFRFEEPGSSNILSHPREIPSLVRRADDTRKNKRQAREERKAAEKAAAEEQTRKLKGQKRREMEAQIKALKQELGGGDDMDWTAVEKIMEGDFDEGEWERVIGTMLNEAADREDDAKPTFDDDLGDAEYDEEDDGTGYDQYAYGNNQDGTYEDVPFEDEEYDDDGPINMDADFEHEPAPSKKTKGKKGKERAVEIEEGLTPAERADKVKQTLDEYKALDHEDMIGDLATRFKYTKSAPVHFGLTPVEILLATDAELNALAGVRHIAPYRRGGLGRTGQGLSRRVRDLKNQLKVRKWGEEPIVGSAPSKERVRGSGSNLGEMGKKRKWGDDNQPPHQRDTAKSDKTGLTSTGPKKRLGKKQRQRAKLAGGAVGSASQEQESSAQPPRPSTEKLTGPREEGDGESKKKRRKKKKSAVETV